MESKNVLILVTKLLFVHLPEVYSNDLPINKLNNFNDQLRDEFIRKTKLAKSVKQSFDNELFLPDKLSSKIGIKY